MTEILLKGQNLRDIKTYAAVIVDDHEVMVNTKLIENEQEEHNNCLSQIQKLFKVIIKIVGSSQVRELISNLYGKDITLKSFQSHNINDVW